MALLSDCHLHSHHSGDSRSPMEDMIQQGIALGLETMCFTEHNDFCYPDTPDGPGAVFLLDTESYLKEVIALKEKYRGQIQILHGVELGLQAQEPCLSQNLSYAGNYPFDFIIGSSHICHGRDPYYPDFYEERTQEEAYREYFSSILENLRTFDDFDVYGHLDYVVRYGPDRDKGYSYEKYRYLLDPILLERIHKGKGLETNTGWVKSGLRELHPATDILKRYRALGGELITIGSDAHKPDAIAAHFDRAGQVLQECGFAYYTVFQNRMPEFRKL